MKRPIKRPTEDAALSHVQRWEKTEKPKLTPEQKQLIQRARDTGDTELLRRALALFQHEED